MSSPAESLDAIREGGSFMVANVLSRLAECERAVQRGDFEGALQAAGQAVDRLTHLHMAHAHLGVLAASSLVRAEDVAPGMVTSGLRIESVEPCACPIEGCQKRIITFDNGSMIELFPGQEMVVNRAP